MKYKLIIKPEAELDILESAKWYNDKRVGLGVAFMEEVENKLKLIQEAPLHFLVY